MNLNNKALSQYHNEQCGVMFRKPKCVRQQIFLSLVSLLFILLYCISSAAIMLLIATTIPNQFHIIILPMTIPIYAIYIIIDDSLTFHRGSTPSPLLLHYHLELHHHKNNKHICSLSPAYLSVGMRHVDLPRSSLLISVIIKQCY